MHDYSERAGRRSGRVRGSRIFRAASAVGASVIVALALGACGSSSKTSTNKKDFKFVNVIKVAGSTWFGRMDVGVKAFTKKTGIPVTQVGPDQATAEGQVSLISSEIPQHPTVIGIDPNDVGGVEGVLKQAQSQGIKVVSQEAATLNNTNFDLEAFDNVAYGKMMMDTLATCMNGSGQYAAFVGDLTVAAQMTWVSSALAEAKAKYPKITRVSGPYASNESETTAYQETLQILRKYPHIKGFEGSASIDVPGIAKAIEASHLVGKVCIVGTSEPILVKPYLASGAVYDAFGWDPGATAEATMYGAELLAEGKKIHAGMNLHVPGYTDIKPCGAGATSHCFEGSAALKYTKQNINDYDF
jgi:simple sugar transport system substrate-binding protein